MRIWLGEMVGYFSPWKVTGTCHASNWNKNLTWRDSANNTQQMRFNPVRKNECSCVTTGLNSSELCDCQKCDYQSRMHMVDNEIEDENNDSESGTGDEQFVRYDIIICCINLVWWRLPFSLSINPPLSLPLISNMNTLYLIFCSKDL